MGEQLGRARKVGGHQPINDATQLVLMQPGSILRKLSRVSFRPIPRASLLQAHSANHSAQTSKSIPATLQWRTQSPNSLLQQLSPRKKPLQQRKSPPNSPPPSSASTTAWRSTWTTTYNRRHPPPPEFLQLTPSPAQHVPRDLEHALHGLHDLTAPRAPLATPIPQHGARLLLASGDAPRH